MKFSTTNLSAAILGLAHAFPLELLGGSGLLSREALAHFEAVKRNPELAEELLQRDTNVVEKRSTGGLLDLTHGGGLLDGILQPLSGALAAIDIPTPQPIYLKKIPGDDPKHQFQAPGATDVRGLCPTLNALANHGYLSRNGITTFAEASNAVQTAYGFGYALSTFLSALGLLAGGDLLSGKYSIGGADARVPNTLGPALGIDKHGVFAIDGSITRQDDYFGNPANFILQRWEEYNDIAKKHGGDFGFDTQAEDVGLRYDNSRSTNPEFFAGAIWFAVSHAERVFVYEALPNGTAPGVADYANVAPFFLNETFPENWYRRGQAFSIVSAFEEAIALGLSNFRPLGGNQGLNNFVPLSLDLNTQSPAEVGCFLVKNIFDLAPGQIAGQFAKSFDLYSGFAKGIIAPFFVNDGYFNCDLSSFVKPSTNAGVTPDGSKSSSGSPVNGAYPGIGVIAPGSQPS